MHRAEGTHAHERGGSGSFACQPVMRSRGNTAIHGAPALEELWRRAADQDAEAFNRIRRRFSTRLSGWVGQIVSDTRARREIVDAVFSHLRHAARPISQAGRSPEAWLALESRARAVDWARAQRGISRGARARLESLEADYSWLPTIQQTALLEERRPLISKALRQLPPSQLRLLDLAVREGLSEREIAEKVGEPEGKIQSELRAAFRFLRHRLRAVMGAWTIGI